MAKQRDWPWPSGLIGTKRRLLRTDSGTKDPHWGQEPQILVDSEFGGGATFTVRLPVARSEPAA
ncbi:MAG: HAMP domain-containing histidine kinase [Acidobacteria bacterium]|nr:HAMP domain-containing histidine kinase [Acidobacteriota bacterium]